MVRNRRSPGARRRYRRFTNFTAKQIDAQIVSASECRGQPGLPRCISSRRLKRRIREGCALNLLNWRRVRNWTATHSPADGVRRPAQSRPPLGLSDRSSRDGRSCQPAQPGAGNLITGKGIFSTAQTSPAIPGKVPETTYEHATRKRRQFFPAQIEAVSERMRKRRAVKKKASHRSNKATSR